MIKTIYISCLFICPNSCKQYDPCDGNPPAFEITDSNIIVYQHEIYIEQINEVRELTYDHIVLELNNLNSSNTKNTVFTIFPTSTPFVYEVNYDSSQSNYTQFVTPLEHINNFDLIINHCPNMKRPEFEGFDKD